MESARAYGDRGGRDDDGRGSSGRPARDLLLSLVAIGAILGIGLLLISRFVAETRDASLILGAVWFAVVGVGVAVYANGRPELRNALFGSFAVCAIAIGAVGYWTGFRETTVDENVVVASETASGAERDAALAGEGDGGASGSAGGSGSGGGAAGRSDQEQQAEKAKKPKPKPAGPVSLAKGSFTGVDGHDSTGAAEVVKDGSKRIVTFTGFSVDPGPGVEVWLTTGPGETSDRIELGDLKGTQGDQQYEIPGGADLGRYDTVMLYCAPFTVRMAVAELS